MQSDAGGGASWIDSSSSSATGRKTRSLTCAGCCASPPSPPRGEGTPPPSEPSIRDGKLYARGAADNKGDLTSRLWAVKALQATRGGVPRRGKVILEGEGGCGRV